MIPPPIVAIDERIIRRVVVANVLRSTHRMGLHPLAVAADVEIGEFSVTDYIDEIVMQTIRRMGAGR